MTETDFSVLVCNLCGWIGSIPKGKKWCQVLISYKYNFELPSDMMVFAYYPYGALGRIEYWRHIDISQFKRGSKGSKKRGAKKRVDEGRDGRELHDDDG